MYIFFRPNRERKEMGKNRKDSKFLKKKLMATVYLLLSLLYICALIVPTAKNWPFILVVSWVQGSADQYFLTHTFNKSFYRFINLRLLDSWALLIESLGCNANRPCVFVMGIVRHTKYALWICENYIFAKAMVLSTRLKYFRSIRK